MHSHQATTLPERAVEQQQAKQPHVAIITSSALTAGRALYAGDSYAAERALRVWFAVFATEQMLIVESPERGEDPENTPPDPATASITDLQEWAQTWIAEDTTFEILPIQTTNPLTDLLNELRDEARATYEAPIKAAVARVAPELAL